MSLHNISRQFQELTPPFIFLTRKTNGSILINSSTENKLRFRSREEHTGTHLTSSCDLSPGAASQMHAYKWNPVPLPEYLSAI